MTGMKEMNLEEDQEPKEVEEFLGEPLEEEVLKDEGLEEELLKPIVEEIPKGNSRAQERIRQVIAQRNAAEQQGVLKDQEILNLKKQNLETQKTVVASQKDTLQRHINSTKALMKKAHTESDSESLVQLTSDLNDAQVKLMALEQWIPQEVKEPAEGQPKGGRVEESPEELHAWVQRNPWFQNPRTLKEQQLVRSAITMYDLLVSDGNDPQETEFYNLIDQRLGLTPIASKGKESVHLGNSSDEEPSKTLKPKGPGRQTVSGASRQPPRPTSGPNAPYNPSARERKIMDILNVKEKDFVREAKKVQKAKEQGKTMTTLFEEDR